jgi:hypothetical protein
MELVFFVIMVAFMLVAGTLGKGIAFLFHRSNDARNVRNENLVAEYNNRQNPTNHP